MAKNTALAKQNAGALTFAQDAAARIRRLLVSTAENTITIGRELNDAKEKLKHGEWLPFLSDCGINPRMAQRFMSVATAFKNDKLSHLKIAPSALYLLASPGTPDDIRQSILGQARTGARITLAAVQQAIGPGEPAEAAPEELPAFAHLPEHGARHRQWLMTACDGAKALAPTDEIDYQRIGAAEGVETDAAAEVLDLIHAADQATRKMRFLINWDCRELEILTNNMCFAAEAREVEVYWQGYKAAEEILRKPWFKPDALAAFRLEFNP